MERSFIFDIKVTMATLKTSFQLMLVVLSFLQLFLNSVSLETIKVANSSNFSAGCPEIEREALLKFKADLKDLSGRLSSWVGKDCCAWQGVRCSIQTGNVIVLDLKNRAPLTFLEIEDRASSEKSEAAYQLSCLGGKLNPSLLELKYLSFLDLSFNNFQGLPIPNFIGSLNELTYLDLSSSSFSGLVPPQLGNLSNLQYLNLNAFSVLNISSYSQLHSLYNYHISDLNWITGLRHLEYLNLAYVNLTSASSTWLQHVNMLPSLAQLYLAYSGLHHFPQTLPLMNFTSLLLLDLQRNGFNTIIPRWLFNISSLMYFRLSSCNMQGSLPNDASTGTLCNLKGLYLSDNNNTGDITGFLGILSECSNSSLEIVEVNRNGLSGQIPDSIGKFKYLRILELGGNSFSGSIPWSVGNLSFLEELNLNANEMSGTIPDAIRHLSGLVTLDLAYNSWKGVVSEDHFSGLAKLQYLSISSLKQSLVIDLKHEWVPPFSLKALVTYDCYWGSELPSWLKTQKNISRLALANASIWGTIPDWVWKLSPQLGLLDLSRNQLGGDVPSALQFRPRAVIDLSFNRLEGSLPVWFNVTYLKLESNLFTGEIPSNFFQEMPLLRALYLSDNLINGSIPTSLSNLNSLQFLDLSKNQFSENLFIPWQYLNLVVINLSNNSLSGEIPPSICSYSYLKVLELFGNNLSGLPFAALRNCTELSTLNLGKNGFSGNIPKWIGKNLLGISVFGLRDNMFTGNIPAELCGLASLHVLDLAHNNFSGFIPPCLGNLSGFKSPSSDQPYDPNDYHYYTDKMELVTKGRQFEYMHTVSLVNLIDLSRNNFIGEIPEEITSLTYLGTLNVSHNQLTGKIPERIGDLQRLESLDLSLNHLSGSIPQSMSSMTLLSYLNLSYNNLSGPIPSSNQFSTFNDPSRFEGNSQLCGSPLPTSCSTLTDNDPGFNGDEGEDEDWIDMRWFYIATLPGFVVGFWIVCGTLKVNRHFRYTYFRFTDRMTDRMFVTLAVS